jgi:hypothetical protein
MGKKKVKDCMTPKIGQLPKKSRTYLVKKATMRVVITFKAHSRGGPRGFKFFLIVSGKKILLNV